MEINGRLVDAEEGYENHIVEVRKLQSAEDAGETSESANWIVIRADVEDNGDFSLEFPDDGQTPSLKALKIAVFSPKGRRLPFDPDLVKLKELVLTIHVKPEKPVAVQNDDDPCLLYTSPSPRD